MNIRTQTERNRPETPVSVSTTCERTPQLRTFRLFKGFFPFAKVRRFSPYARISSRSCSKFCVRIVFNGLPADDGCFKSWEPMPICRN